jgi:DNA (cytosine-5)-methyltransferase 1
MRILDLFSGIGGFSLGLEKAGFETAAFCEFDEHARKVLKKHWPTVPIFNDVNTLTGLEVEFTVGKIDVICGGFPCQDISVAGKQRGLINEEGSVTRSGLWFEYKRLIGELRPSYVIIENVANLRSNGLVTVLQDLWSLGYDAEWNVISARSIGAVHLRERLWVVAYPNRDRSEKGIPLQAGNEGKSLFTRGTSEERKIKSSDSDGEGLEGHGKAGNVGQVRAQIPSSSRSLFAPYPDDVRLGESVATEEEKSERWAKRTACFRNWWEAESEFCRMDDAISSGLDESERFRKQRIKQLGNSIVPGIAEIIGNAIMEYESKDFL